MHSRSPLKRRPARLVLAGAGWLLPLLALAGPLAGSLAEPPAAPLALTEVLQQARTGSREVRQGEARLQAAEGQRLQAQGAFDWTLAAETGWERLYVLDAQDGLLRDRLRGIEAWRTTLGAGRQFRNGWSVKPGVSVYRNTGISDAQAFGLTRTRPQVNLTVPLLRGRGDNGSAASRERAAGLDYDAAARLQTYEIQTAVTGAAVQYWQCLALQQQRAVARDDLAAEDRYVARLAAYAGAGQLEPYQHDRAVARQTGQRLQLAALERRHAGCLLELPSARPATAGIDAVADGFPAPEFERVTALDVERLVEHARHHRGDLQAAALNLDARAQLSAAARDGQRPTLNMTLDPQRVMLSLAQSFGGSGAEGLHREALAHQEEARLQLDELGDRARLDLREQVAALQEAATHGPALGAAVAATEHLVLDVQSRVEHGWASDQDLRAAQQELAALRRAQIDLQLQYATATSLLRLLSGHLDATVADAAALRAQLVTLP